MSKPINAADHEKHAAAREHFERFGRWPDAESERDAKERADTVEARLRELEAALPAIADNGGVEP